MDTLTAERILLGGRLWLAGSGRSRLAAASVLATITALDFFLENGGFLLDLAEAVLDGVVGGVEVEGDCSVVDLGDCQQEEDMMGWLSYFDARGDDAGHDALPGLLAVPVDSRTLGHC